MTGAKGSDKIRTENDDDKASLEKLFRLGGQAIYEPLFQRIIDAAKTPKAADSYISKLGWGNDIASQVRNGVRMRDQYPQTWAGIKVSSDRRPSDIFGFSEPVDFDPMFTLTSSITIAGVSKDTDHLPFFLRDYMFSRDTEEGKPVRWFNSFDFDGSYRIEHVKNLSWPLFSFGHSGNFWNKQIGPGMLCINKSHNGGAMYAEWETNDANFSVRSRSLIIDNDNGLPVFCKAAQVKNRLGSISEGDEEHVNVFYRQDLGPDYPPDGDLGWLEYVRTIPVSTMVNCVLRMKYRLKTGRGSIIRVLDDPLRPVPPVIFRSTPDRQRVDPVGLELSERVKGVVGELPKSKHFPSVVISDAMAGLATLAGLMYDRNSTPDLEKLLGRGIMNSPPPSLAELFF